MRTADTLSIDKRGIGHPCTSVSTGAGVRDCTLLNQALRGSSSWTSPGQKKSVMRSHELSCCSKWTTTPLSFLPKEKGLKYPVTARCCRIGGVRKGVAFRWSTHRPGRGGPAGACSVSVVQQRRQPPGQLPLPRGRHQQLLSVPMVATPTGLVA